MKKTILGLFAFVCAFSGSSCSEDDLSGTSVIKPEQTTETPLDAWLYKNYIEPYNIEFRYRYEDMESDMIYDLTPANYEKSVQMAKLVKHLCLQAYDEVTGSRDFITSSYAMTITLLTDSQGKKMGKTAGNAVWLDPNKTSPFEFYQYWRNVGDSDVMKCIRMLTFLPLEQIDEMSTWKDQRLNEAKEILAFELTKMVHGEEEAAKAQNAARALFSGASGDAEHMPNTQLTEADLTDGSIGILTLMVKAGLAASNGEARRLVVQGGVLVDGEKVAAPTVSFTAEQLSKGIVIKKGKKVYHKVSL